MKHIIIYLSCLLFTTNSFAQQANSNLIISRLTGDFYIYESFNTYQGLRIPANSMYLVTDKGVVLFDTPWDTTQFQPLLDSIKARHQRPVLMCIATHFHADKTAGLEYFRRKGIKTYSTRQTDELSIKNGMKRAEMLMNTDTTFTVGQYSFQTYYPGGGHTADNIVIWFDKEKILYGGCLVKSTEASNLGYLGDADIKAYPKTMKKLIRKFKLPKYVIPGHDSWQDPTSLQHTLKMALKLKPSDKN